MSPGLRRKYPPEGAAPFEASRQVYTEATSSSTPSAVFDQPDCSSFEYKKKTGPLLFQGNGPSFPLREEPQELSPLVLQRGLLCLLDPFPLDMKGIAVVLPEGEVPILLEDERVDPLRSRRNPPVRQKEISLILIERAGVILQGQISS